MFTMFRIPALALVTLTAVSLAIGDTTAHAGTEWYGSQVVRTSLTGENGTLGEQFFHVDWTAALTSPGQATMTGYVYNDYGQPAKDVQLEITVVNPNGEAVEHVIRPVRGLVPAEGRAYFSVQVPESPAPYRVTVASFDFLEFPSGR